MSVLRTVLCGLRRPFTCTVLHRCSVPGVSPMPARSFSSSPQLYAPVETFDDVQAVLESEPKKRQPVQKDVVKSYKVHDPDWKMGDYIPTTDVYETIHDGIRYDKLPFVYIKSTKNNTHASAYAGRSKGIAMQTGGKVGFKNTRKNTNVCGQTVGFALGLDMIKRGHKTARVVLKGFGQGRLAALKGLQSAGINIVSVSDQSYPDVTNRPPGAKDR